ncbi:hypothetical protein [Stieleria neptunia]|nr:hypothetical protein [Stieleria neptunia]
MSVLRHALTSGDDDVAGIHRMHRPGNIRSVAVRRVLEGDAAF